MPVTYRQRMDLAATPAPGHVPARSTRSPAPAAATARSARAWAGSASSASSGPAHQRAGPPHIHAGVNELRERVVHYLLGPGSGLSCPLSESSSKSACAFPMISSAAWVRAKSLASFVLSAQPLQLGLLGRARAVTPTSRPRRLARPATPGVWLLGRCTSRQHARVAGLAPLDDVRVVQPFPAQQRAALARLGRPVVLGHHPQLVLRREHPPARLVTTRAAARTHHTIIDPNGPGVSEGQGHES